VQFKARPTKSEVRDNWTVALEYDEEGQGPWLVDLAHKTRWDLQDSRSVSNDPATWPYRQIRVGALCQQHAG
jgi:hypothetical protein